MIQPSYRSIVSASFQQNNLEKGMRSAQWWTSKLQDDEVMERLSTKPLSL